jgi:hypothetical protein
MKQDLKDKRKEQWNADQRGWGGWTRIKKEFKGEERQ